jgi:SAM-dependent methyltransferase
MTTVSTDAAFAGSIPDAYDRYLVPTIFEYYAADLARRLAATRLTNVLEIAAGTGVVTRALASTLPKAITIVATDLNQGMLNAAAKIPMVRPVEWRQADAMHLPFADESFDAVVCQFGVMFFPDKSKGLAEMRRVLRPGGTLLYAVWDSLAHNELADAVTSAVKALYPGNPPMFLARTPYAYFDSSAIQRDLSDAGFTKRPRIETVPARSRAPTALDAARGFTEGTPLRTEIEAHGTPSLREATDAAAALVAQRFGNRAVDAKMQAHVITVEK